MTIYELPVKNIVLIAMQSINAPTRTNEIVKKVLDAGFHVTRSEVSARLVDLKKAGLVLPAQEGQGWRLSSRSLEEYLPELTVKLSDEELGLFAQ